MDLALFDFDGTVTERDPSKGKDSFSGFVRFAVRPSRKAVGAVLLGPVLLGYRLRWISASRARRAVVMVAFRGESAGRVRQLGLQFATEALPPSMRQRALERIRWHQDRGDEVVVVSAALDVYLRPLCQTNSAVRPFQMVLPASAGPAPLCTAGALTPWACSPRPRHSMRSIGCRRPRPFLRQRAGRKAPVSPAG